MSWARTHRRNAVVEAVLADVGRRGPGVLETWLPRVEADFDDFGQFLQHVQRRWNTHWAARLDLLIERGQAQDARAVRAQWRRQTRALSGTRELLDAYADHPALRRGARTYDALELGATGLPATQPSRKQPATKRTRTRLRDRRCPLLALR